MIKFFNIPLKEVTISITVAFIFMIVAYLIMNLSFTLPLAIEKPKLRGFETIRNSFFHDKVSSWSDSILCIDVSHDQVLAMEYKGKEAIGQTSVTDHEKLFRLLQVLHENNKDNYRFILLDILFDKYVTQSVDSLLFKYIENMPNVVIPIPDKPIADECLLPKAAQAKYATTHWDGGFTKYPYILNNEPSIPLYMYEALTDYKIFNPLHFVWWDRGIARNSVFLTFDLKDNDSTKLYLGRCLGDPVNGVPLKATIKDKTLTKGKYIIIGDFERDRHSTFLGSMSGPMINFNAYVALVNGQHRISYIMILSILLFLSTFCYAIMYSSKCWEKLVFTAQVKVITVILIILCLLLYSICNIVYDIYIFVFLFWILHIGSEYGVGQKLNSTIVFFIFLALFVIVLSLMPEQIIAWPLFIIAMFLPFYKDIQKLKMKKLNNMMSGRRYILGFLVFFIMNPVVTIKADNEIYIIQNMDLECIPIGGQIKHIGDEFNEKDTIYWPNITDLKIYVVKKSTLLKGKGKFAKKEIRVMSNNTKQGHCPASKCIDYRNLAVRGDKNVDNIFWLKKGGIIHIRVKHKPMHNMKPEIVWREESGSIKSYTIKRTNDNEFYEIDYNLFKELDIKKNSILNFTIRESSLIDNVVENVYQDLIVVYIP